MTGYRPDIDGLRAVAVLAVVLFHAGVPGWSGGFVGVDVFFVISGFLITGVIKSAEEKGGFSIAEFYERRIRRILPALFVVIVATFGAAALVFLPRDVDRVGQSVVATSLFASNVLFWRRAGYFEATAHTKPLLHTWSLSVEEQYYLLFPLVFVFLLRRGPRTARIGLLAMGAVSFAAALWLVDSAPSAAFYLPQSRVWELLVGAALAAGLVPKVRTARVADALVLFGLGLIGGSIVLLDEYSSFPGLGALAPVVGSALVILGGMTPASRASRLLSVRPLVFIGLTSYSWYLWHWPILSIVGYSRFGRLSLTESLLLVTAAFVLAVASWRWVETPFRRSGGVFNRRSLFAASAVGFIGLVGIGAWAVAANGWEGQALPDVVRLERAGDDNSPHRARCHASDRNPIPYERSCVFGDSAQAASVVVWGDSYGAELAPALGAASGELGGAVRQLTYSACSAGSSYAGSPKERCSDYNRVTLEALRADSSVHLVIMVGNYPSSHERHFAAYFSEFRRVALALREMGKQVAFVFPHPKYAFAVPAQLALTVRRGAPLDSVGMQRADFDAAFGDRRAALESIRAEGGFEAIDPREVLCPTARCLTMRDGRVLYFDELHLSMAGAGLLMPRVRALTSRP